MLTIMNMSSGRVDDLTDCYDEAVLHAGWTEVPRLEPRLELVQTAPREPDLDTARFLAAFYAAQE